MEKLKKLKYTFQTIRDNIKNMKSEYNFYRQLWDKPQSKEAVSDIKIQLFYLLKKIRPHKIEGNVIFGTGDPASTGEILGAAAVFYGMYPEKLRIIPDFEEQRLEGNLHVKGKLRLIHLLIIMIRLIADKNVRYMIKKMKSKEDVRDERK